MATFVYELREAGTTELSEYKDSFKLRFLAPLNTTEFAVIETKVENQVYYKKTIKSKVVVGKDDAQYLYSRVSECVKFILNIYKKCNGQNNFIYRAQFTPNNIEFDLDRCTAQIELSDSTPYACVEKNRNVKYDYIAEAALSPVEIKQRIQPSGAFTERYRAEDFLKVVNRVLSLINCRGYIGDKKIVPWYAVSDFFNWQIEVAETPPATYSAISYDTFPTGGGPLLPIANYVNPLDNPYYILIGIKSDANLPTATNPATVMNISFADIEKIMSEVFNVYWIMEPENYIRFEHFSYFTRQINYDAINATNFPYNKAKNKIKIDKDDFPYKEMWKFNDHKFIDYVGKPIVYPNCNNGDTIDRGADNVCTDFPNIYSTFAAGNAASLDNSGFMLYDVIYQSPPPSPPTTYYNLVSATGLLSVTAKLNARLSLANLHYDLHRHNRPFSSGDMNNNPTAFLSPIYKKQQEGIIVKMCCTDDFKKEASLVKTELGNGIIEEAEVDYNEERIKFKVKQK